MWAHVSIPRAPPLTTFHPWPTNAVAKSDAVSLPY